MRSDRYILPVVMEDYALFARTKRCGPLCTEFYSRDTLGAVPMKDVMSEHEKAHNTPCIAAKGLNLENLDQYESVCERGDLLRSFVVTRWGCPTAHHGRVWVRLGWRCSRNAPPGVEFAAVERYTPCASVRGGSIAEMLSVHDVSCPEGFAIAAWSLRSDGCAQTGTMQYRYQCASLITAGWQLPGRAADPPKLTRDASAALQHLQRERNARLLGGGEMYGKLPVRPSYTTATPCQEDDRTMTALEKHPMHCPPTHAIASFRLEYGADNCTDATVTGYQLGTPPVAASCLQLRSACKHATFGAAIRAKCPLTCGTCRASWGGASCSSGEIRYVYHCVAVRVTSSHLDGRHGMPVNMLNATQHKSE